MKVVIQRVKRASCIVNHQVISSIDHGYMILVGFTHTDNEDKVRQMAKKIASLRVFADEFQKLNLDIKQVNGSILSISQFTLYASTQKGNRPSFVDAMEPKLACKLYQLFNNILNEEYQIKTLPGSFGSDMKLDILCDGPVTIEMEY